MPIGKGNHPGSYGPTFSGGKGSTFTMKPVGGSTKASGTRPGTTMYPAGGSPLAAKYPDPTMREAAKKPAKLAEEYSKSRAQSAAGYKNLRTGEVTGADVAGRTVIIPKKKGF